MMTRFDKLSGIILKNVSIFEQKNLHHFCLVLLKTLRSNTFNNEEARTLILNKYFVSTLIIDVFEHIHIYKT